MLTTKSYAFCDRNYDDDADCHNDDQEEEEDDDDEKMEKDCEGREGAGEKRRGKN